MGTLLRTRDSGIPRRCAISITLSIPTAAPSRKNAQLTEFLVASLSFIVPPPPSAFRVRNGCNGSMRTPLGCRVQGEEPSIESSGENPFSIAVVSVIALNVEPGCRPKLQPGGLV